MIYLKFNHIVGERYGVPELLVLNTSFENMKIRLKYIAEEIFEFSNGKTVYYKDRGGSNYQYTEDEIIMFKLKNG